MEDKKLTRILRNCYGLQIQWDKSTARWLGPKAENKPSWVEDLSWCWKERGENTKLLGFSFEEGIDAGDMIRRCKQRVNEVCSNPLYGNLSIYGRVTIANAVLLGAFWSYIPLWAGDREELQKLEKQVVNFVWSGASMNTRNRAATKIITQRLKDGGLGLISLTGQYMAFTARMVRWAYHPGEHPLQRIIRAKVEELSMDAFGIPGVQWIYSPAREKIEGVSAVLRNVLATWEKLKCILRHRPLHTMEDWKGIQLWGTAQGSKDGKIRKVDSKAKKLLWEEGHKTLGDVATEDGMELAAWEQRKIRGTESRAVRTAFSKLSQQIKGPTEELEDTLHTFWGCSAVQSTWKAVRNFAAAAMNQEGWRPRCNHILLAKNLPRHLHKHEDWWESLRDATIWRIWMARNAKNFSGEDWHPRKIDSTIWYRFTLYIQAEWRQTRGDGREDFKTNWCFENLGIVLDDNQKLTIPRQAPWKSERVSSRRRVESTADSRPE
ncbi:hypothetical protein R1sor_021332 [Riccia sorocarpa]|uniref:Uncharacterized protein n=1 Tax=Riccia sorocarpa TaxID=122646 RepID=A0ABD3GIE4_9MARC